MSQSGEAGDSKSAKRFQNPAYVYGPMVYQFPPESERESSKSKSSDNGQGLLVVLLISILIIGGVFLFLRERGVDLSPALQRFQSQLPDTTVTFARVTADSLYLREGPGTEYIATYLLPYDWPLTLLGESHLDRDGDVWVRVRLETEQGLQEGWVNQRYLETITT